MPPHLPKQRYGPAASSAPQNSLLAPLFRTLRACGLPKLTSRILAYSIRVNPPQIITKPHHKSAQACGYFSGLKLEPVGESKPIQTHPTLVFVAPLICGCLRDSFIWEDAHLDERNDSHTPLIYKHKRAPQIRWRDMTFEPNRHD